jgi:hypothetical protein
MTAYVPSLEEKDMKKVIRSVREIASGRSNATGQVTLKDGAISTTVTDSNCAVGTVPLLVPTTADAAAELKNGTLFVAATAINNGSFTITHANNTSKNRIFLYAFIG